jgi:hypothetical protein
MTVSLPSGLDANNNTHDGIIMAAIESKGTQCDSVVTGQLSCFLLTLM